MRPRDRIGKVGGAVFSSRKFHWTDRGTELDAGEGKRTLTNGTASKEERLEKKVIESEREERSDMRYGNLSSYPIYFHFSIYPLIQLSEQYYRRGLSKAGSNHGSLKAYYFILTAIIISKYLNIFNRNKISRKRTT